MSEASQVVVVVESVPSNAGDIRDAGSISGLGRSPGEGDSDTPTLLLGEPQEQRSLVRIVRAVTKSWSQLR